VISPLIASAGTGWSSAISPSLPRRISAIPLPCVSAAELVAGLPAAGVAVQQHLDRMAFDFLAFAVVDRHGKASDIRRDQVGCTNDGGDRVSR
jgi:hypothetical protein